MIKQSIEHSRYNCVPLKSLIIQNVAGDWGSDISDDYDSSKHTKCLVLRATEFNINHNLIIDKSKAKYRLINNRKLTNIDLQINDLLIEKSGGSENQPVGRVAIITKELFESDTLCFSNFVQKIRIDGIKAMPEYVFLFLRLINNLKLTETMQSQTNGIHNLILSEYYSQQIPLPPIKTQEIIVAHVAEIYEMAKQLQQEAIDIISASKNEIERRILGQ